MKYPVLTPRGHNPLLHRICPMCRARMWLAVIEPVTPGEDKLIFECTDCGREEFVEVKLNYAAQPVAPVERFRAC